jgi:hypothetical protein
MPLADSMKQFVNELKSSRASRNAYVKGLKENTKALREENRTFFKNIHDQNQMLKQQTEQFVQYSKKAREETFKQTMDNIKVSLDSVHQSSQAIIKDARDSMGQYREDAQKAHEYWLQMQNDDLIPDEPAPKEVPEAQALEQAEQDKVVAKAPQTNAQQQADDQSSPVEEPKKLEQDAKAEQEPTGQDDQVSVEHDDSQSKAQNTDTKEQDAIQNKANPLSQSSEAGKSIEDKQPMEAGKAQ